METSVPQPIDDPKAEYVRRLEGLRTKRARYEAQHRRLGIAKLAFGGATLVLIGLALIAKLISVLWIVVPVFAILFLALIHDRVRNRLERCLRAVAYYERGLARIDNRWAGVGETGERFASATHPYSRDLDLFGDGSLFQLLCLARTPAGQAMLAGWLLAPAPPEVVRARQAGIAELRNRLDLREDLAVLAEETRAVASAEALAAWGEGEPELASSPLRLASALLAGLWLASLVAWMVWGLGYVAALVSAANLSFNLYYRRRVGQVVSAVEGAARDLSLLSGVLARLETEQFAAPRLIELRAALDAQGQPPSRSIAQLNRLMDYLDSRRNLIVKTVDPFVLWTFQCACAIEAWRKQCGPAVRRWLASVGEFEALSSLGAYAYEHPADVSPEFVDASPCLHAEGFAHPLLSDSTAVRNDLCFGHSLRVLIISGPNMAGKSTLVRALGLNVVLAQCGAAVRAQRLRLSPLAVGASICVLDSLQGGISRFYAEIRRLKQISDLTHGSLRVLFLLDEFLQGTNSHDRRVGAEAMVRSLMGQGAIGLVTTHDLALAEIPGRVGPGAANAHFDDRLQDGKLIFDYRLKPGIVQTSNALELMRSLGLDV
jgi:ABC-type multidrug transport system fused ATPase/permease subunit